QAQRQLMLLGSAKVHAHANVRGEVPAGAHALVAAVEMLAGKCKASAGFHKPWRIALVTTPAQAGANTNHGSREAVFAQVFTRPAAHPAIPVAANGAAAQVP